MLFCSLVAGGFCLYWLWYRCNGWNWDEKPNVLADKTLKTFKTDVTLCTAKSYANANKLPAFYAVSNTSSGRYDCYFFEAGTKFTYISTGTNSMYVTSDFATSSPPSPSPSSSSRPPPYSSSAPPTSSSSAPPPTPSPSPYITYNGLKFKRRYKLIDNAPPGSHDYLTVSIVNWGLRFTIDPNIICIPGIITKIDHTHYYFPTHFKDGEYSDTEYTHNVLVTGPNGYSVSDIIIELGRTPPAQFS